MKKPKLCDGCGKRPGGTIRVLTLRKRNGRIAAREKTNLCDACTTKTMQALCRAMEKSTGF